MVSKMSETNILKIQRISIYNDMKQKKLQIHTSQLEYINQQILANGITFTRRQLTITNDNHITGKEFYPVKTVLHCYPIIAPKKGDTVCVCVCVCVFLCGRHVLPVGSVSYSTSL